MLAPYCARRCTALAIAIAIPITIAACSPKTSDDSNASVGDTLGDTDETTDTDFSDWIAPNRAVDVLFVIDNSLSMGGEQAALAISADALIAELEAADADYHIGITTTDNGNPWCPPGSTTPEQGNLVLQPCKDRIGNFISANGEYDATDIACNDICSLSAAELEIQPTLTYADYSVKPRRWIQRIEGQTNLPPGTDVAEALRCFLPQGINGCGFESQLESMYLALTRADDPNDPDNYGFRREGAVLAIVIVSDEADCSYNTSYAQIFEADGGKLFWSDPDSAFPSSAVCWNAGVTCTGDPSSYSSCSPVNKDILGTEGVADADAVLHPTSRYVELLAGLEQAAQSLDAERELIVALIGGVTSDGTPVYADATGTDPLFQYGFGIGPGCESPDPNNPEEPNKAVPPVRMLDITNTFSPGNLFSICAADFSSPMTAVAQQIISQL